MAIDPTTRSADFTQSIRKYFLGNLEAIENIKLFFEVISDVPTDVDGNKINKWIIITFGNKTLGAVTEQFVSFDLFTRKDAEGDDLSALTDTVLSYIINEDSTSGLVTIPFYDVTEDPWVIVGGVIPFISPLQAAMEGKDSTRIQNITLVCKWGGK